MASFFVIVVVASKRLIPSLTIESESESKSVEEWTRKSFGLSYTKNVPKWQMHNWNWIMEMANCVRFDVDFVFVSLSWVLWHLYRFINEWMNLKANDRLPDSKPKVVRKCVTLLFFDVISINRFLNIYEANGRRNKTEKKTKPTNKRFITQIS